ncbi:protein crumbs homolog 2b isoform X2 [Tachysurus fulvidraco]|uniref:protein crumbs homolog 2b isoform X2 n=1 Tax=Tachysurus fulvidraco TaxID=1234273 RepID=UPI001FEF30CE|nr:protein crumbs homolog 2b isoform X2 [Tachysurus fulvidraco]
MVYLKHGHTQLSIVWIRHDSSGGLASVIEQRIFCTAKADICLSSPCQNGGTCIDVKANYTCLCPKEPLIYVGKDCELLYDACTHANCHNCISTLGIDNYFCPCPEGFGGPDCTLNLDKCKSNPCTGIKNRCVDAVYGYSCHCPSSYSGEDCKTQSAQLMDCLDNPCFNNATCIQESHGYECRCGPGFYGTYCEYENDECLSQPCQNGAICLDGIDVYQCFCVPGFQGYNCEIDINECASQPCGNNGKCFNGKDRYICECLIGFTGVNCEAEINECEVTPCQNGATCHDYIGKYICECVSGFEGISCEVDINECISLPCLNNGSCIDLVNRYECDCSGTGFGGSFCEEEILECASEPCQHGAKCHEGINQYTCQCWPGYEGNNCEMDVDECKAQPCENGGMCFQRSDQTNYGVLAQLGPSFSYKHADGFLCKCLAGFTGENCSFNIDDCEVAPCLNGGSCEDRINAYQCFCTPGFTGFMCELDIDECNSAPCKNGALCEDVINDYICHCPISVPGQMPWGGRNCEIALTGCVDKPCNNGGMCEPFLHGDKHLFKCRCPSGFSGDNCSIPTTFSFSKAAYVVMNVPFNETYNNKSTSVSLRFRTTLPDVVLFFRGNAQHFFMLEMNGGNLLAMAESGDLKLVVELHGNFNDGKWYAVSVSVYEMLILRVFDKNYTYIEQTDHNPHLLFPPHCLDKVYIGCVPHDYMKKTKMWTGFIGCMEDFVISSQLILPHNFSQENITYVHKGCEKPEWCDLDSCSHHGQCIDLWTEYKCDCHRPFYGNICSKEYPSWTFSHEHNRSFAAFPITRRHAGNISISFLLRTRKNSGLILQFQRGNQSYFSVFLQRGTINVDAFSSTRESSMIITNGEKMLITIDVQGGYLYFNHTKTLFSPGIFPELEVQAGDVLYLGGLPEERDTVPWGGHFKGCLQDIWLDDIQLYMNINKIIKKDEQPKYLADISYNLLEHCVSDETCKGRPCLNGGECIIIWNDFICSCPQNYTGKTCDIRVWCASSPCAIGSQCVDLPDGYECLANATFENNALKFSASGSLSAPVTVVSVKLRTRTENGTLLRSSSGLEFFHMGLLNSFILVKICNSKNQEVLPFYSDVEVSDGEWHYVELRKTRLRYGSSLWKLTVDGQMANLSKVFAANLDFFNHSTVWLAENFTGCLGEVRIGGVYLPLVGGIHEEAPQFSKFIHYGCIKEPKIGCSGAPVCVLQPCLNNGSCRDLFNLYRCDCAPGWQGENCQDDINECISGPCIHGTCKNLPGEYLCQCALGYRGRHCNEDVDECQELHCENLGSCLNFVGGYTCICPPAYSGPLCQWSFPPMQCRVDVQCMNGGVCINGPWGANCTCRPGYTGERCEVDIDDCESNPCLNGASCMDQKNHYICECMPGFSGDKCEAPRQQKRESIPWLIVAVPMMCFAALLAMVGLGCMMLTARRKRQSEGTYSPSQQEVAGARLEMGSVLKVPPEERLI